MLAPSPEGISMSTDYGRSTAARPDPTAPVPWYRSWSIVTVAVGLVIWSTGFWLIDEFVDHAEDLTVPAIPLLGSVYVLAIIPAIWRLHGYRRGLTWTGLFLAVFWLPGLVLSLVLGALNTPLRNTIVLSEEKHLAPVHRYKAVIPLTLVLLAVSGLLAFYGFLQAALAIPSVLMLVLLSWVIGMIVTMGLKCLIWIKDTILVGGRRARFLTGPTREDWRDTIIWVAAVGRVGYSTLSERARLRRAGGENVNVA